MATEAARLFISVGADTDQAERGLRRVSGQMDAFAVAAGTLAADAARTLAGGMVEMGRQGLAAATDYQTSLNMFGAVSGATAQQLDQVGQLARELGADMTLPATSAGDAAAAMTELAKAGLSVDQSMSAAKGVLQLSAAGALSNAEAAEIAANALNSFGLEGGKAARVADLFAATANKSSVEVKDVGDSFKMASAVFAAFQGPAVGAEQAMVDLTTAIGILGNAGIKGSDAGTSLKQSLLMLSAPAEKTKGLMRELAASIGEGGDIAYTADGRMRSLPQILDLVARSTANLTEEERNHAITQIFGADASRAVIALMRAGPQAFGEMQAAITQQGAAADLAGARMQGLGGAVAGFQSTMETALMTAVLPFLPALEGLVRGAADLVGQAPIEQWATAAANGFSGLIGLVGAVVTGFQQAGEPILGAGAAINLVLNRVFDLNTNAGFLVTDVLNGLIAGFNQVGETLGGNLRTGLDWLTGTGLPAARDLFGQVADGVNTGLRSAWDWLTGTGLPAAQSGLGQFTDLLSPLRDALQPVIEGFQEGGLQGALAAVPGAIGPVIGSANDLRNQLVKLALDGVADLTDQLADSAGFESFLEQLGLSESQIGDVKAILGDLSGGLRTVGGWVVDVGRWLQNDLLPPVIEAGRGFADMLLPHLRWLADFGNAHVMPFLRDIGGFIGTNLPGAIDVVSPLLTGLVDVGLSAVELALKAIATTWETWLKPAFEAIGTWLSDLTGGWDNLARGAEVLKGTMESIAQAIRDVAAGRVDFSQIFGGLGELARMLGLGGGEQDGIPGFAGGVRNFRGGLAIVGERGPELLRLPGGSDVYNAEQLAGLPNLPIPATASSAVGAVGAGGLIVNITVQGSVVTERDLAQRVREQLIDYQRYNGTTNIG